MSHNPKISVITPSLNQGQFIEETILSVIGQGYPNLEYIIYDGGSIDDTVEIIKKYERFITYWVSEKDYGQSDAINKGFLKATGDIVCWLNSDDILLPGAIEYIAKTLNPSKETILFGNCILFFENGVQIKGTNVKKDNETKKITQTDYIIQPSSFYTRKVLDKVGLLRTDLHYAFDWEWFVRAKKNDIEFYPTDKYLSMYRVHSQHKTSTGGISRAKEIAELFNAFGENELYKIALYVISNSPKFISQLKYLRQHKFLNKYENIIMRFLFPKTIKYKWQNVVLASVMMC